MKYSINYLLLIGNNPLHVGVLCHLLLYTLSILPYLEEQLDRTTKYLALTLHFLSLYSNMTLQARLCSLVTLDTL